MPDIRELISDFVSEFSKKNLGTYASSTTYSMMLSFFPALILVSSIVPFTSLSEADVTEFLLTIMPDASQTLIQQICRETYRASGGMLPISIILTLWSAGFGVMQLTRGLNVINDVTEHRNYFLLRLTSMLYTLLVLALMVSTLLLQIFVMYLVGLWESVLPGVKVPDILTSALRYIVLFVVAIVLFVLLFTTLPDAPKNPLHELPGALVAAVGWEVFSAIFSLYVRYSQNLNVYYGSLTTVVVLMLWVYWCLYIVLFGAFLNHFIETRGRAGSLKKGSRDEASRDQASN